MSGLESFMIGVMFTLVIVIYFKVCNIEKKLKDK